MAKGIYVASKTIHAAMWRNLRALGEPITATWIDEAGEGQTANYSELAARCLREVSESCAVVLLSEGTLKGALIEAGAALALGIPVFAVGDGPSVSRVFRCHPLWHRCGLLVTALREAKLKA